MNWLLIGLIVFLALMAAIGWHRGFSRMAISLCATILSVVLVSVTSAFVVDFIKEKTTWDDDLSIVYQENLFDNISADATLETYIGALPLPSAAQTAIRSLVTEHAAEPIREVVSGYLAGLTLTGIVDIVLFIIYLLLIHLLGKLLDAINRIPGFHQINGLLGALLGLVEAMVIIWLLALLLLLLSGTEFGLKILQMVYDSPFLKWIYEHNLLTVLFDVFKQKLFG